MEENIENIISGDLQKLPEALNLFIEKANSLFTFPFLDQNNYRSDLWKALYKYISTDKYTSIKLAALTTLRILGREKKDLKDLITVEMMQCICNLADLKQDLTNAKNYTEIVEALKCLVNFVFNGQFIPLICFKIGAVDAIVKRIADKQSYKNAPEEMELLDLRVLYILSAMNSEISAHLRKYYSNVLADYLNEKLTNFIDNPKPLTDLEVDMFCEMSKVIFNISMMAQVSKLDENDFFTKLARFSRDVLLLTASTESKRLDLQKSAIHLLTIVPELFYKELFLPQNSKIPIVKQMQYEGANLNAIGEIVDFLKVKMDSNPADSIANETLGPVLIVLIKCATSDRILRKYLRQQILPPLKDVSKRPEEGNTIRNALCRHLTSPIVEIQTFVADLLFILCKENIGRMIKYTGYGNAAGLLANRGLLGKETNKVVDAYSSDSDDSGTEEYKQAKHGINPVLGCYEPPRPKPTDNMTEEQKEYEAMQLVQLIDKLSKQGIVQPCRVGADGTPKPVEHILELTENAINSNKEDDDEDED